jgi:hypothetical protein
VSLRPPPGALYAPTTSQTAAGRRGIQRGPRVAANVIVQCDHCGCTDDAEHRIGRTRHEGCRGTYRAYGHVGGAA